MRRGGASHAKKPIVLVGHLCKSEDMFVGAVKVVGGEYALEAATSEFQRRSDRAIYTYLLKMAPKHASVEIWQTILRYSISVPVFFDTDPLNTYSIGDFLRLYTEEYNYWKSERTRNSLRRVCSSWNAYLKRFDHRFVRLEDVANEHVPPAAVSRATRLQLRPLEISESSVAPFFNLAIQEGLEEWNVEILDRTLDDANKSETWKKRVTKLKVIIDGSGVEPELFLEFYPNLSLVSFLDRSPNLTSTLSMPNLTTLAIDLPYSQIYHQLYAPSLRHLSIVRSSMHPTELINILQVVGKGLNTLTASCGVSQPSEHIFPTEIWPLCPQLEVVQTSFRWYPEVTFPKSLRLLRVSADFDGASTSRLPATALVAAGMRSVSIAQRWYNAFYEDTKYLGYIKIAMDHGLTILDEEDVPFHEFLVLLLSVRYKRQQTRGLPMLKIAYRTFF